MPAVGTGLVVADYQALAVGIGKPVGAVQVTNHYEVESVASAGVKIAPAEHGAEMGAGMIVGLIRIVHGEIKHVKLKIEVTREVAGDSPGVVAILPEAGVRHLGSGLDNLAGKLLHLVRGALTA